MAAPITHIVLAEKIFEKYFADKDKKEFFLGTSFPDIRYLGALDRSKTHFKVSNIQDTLESSAFLSGMKFHSLVDIVRERFMRNNGLYDLFPKSQVLSMAIKVFEDGILYKRINNWKEIISFFEDINKNEAAFGVSNQNIEKWHILLKHYFSQPPITDKAVKMLVEDMGHPAEMADKIIKVLAGIKDKDKAAEIVNNFYSSSVILLA